MRRVLEVEVMLMRIANWSNIDGPARGRAAGEEAGAETGRDATGNDRERNVLAPLGRQQAGRERTLAEEVVSLHAVGHSRRGSRAGAVVTMSTTCSTSRLEPDGPLQEDS